MNRMLAALFIIVCFTPGFAKTGDLQVLSDILEERIKSRRPEWELLNKHVDDHSMLIEWKNALPEKKETYYTIIIITPSIAAAAKTLAEAPPSSAGNRGVEIQGVGQDARLVEHKRGSQISIEFREENFIVRLVAPSEPKGRRFARYIIDSIATLQQRK
ncbi:MAG TPA: hypothetical protein VJZ77_03805 [Blastocatellia bacterium]|nr:hypothetical protein [Blastocatellia bacterium]